MSFQCVTPARPGATKFSGVVEQHTVYQKQCVAANREKSGMASGVAVCLSFFSGVYRIVPKVELEEIARMRDDWLGELAFVHYWRVLEEHGCGVMKAPEFAHISLAERQAWIEAAKAVGEQVREGLLVASSMNAHGRIQDPVSTPYSTRRAMMGSTRDARRAGT
jgi:hypothetical protein